MAYSTSNPPRLEVQAIAGSRMWIYESTDDAATVRAAGYITNGGKLGMKVGDRVMVIDTDAAPNDGYMMSVVTVNATTGVVDLTDGVELFGANT